MNELSAYEVQRLKNIEFNKSVLQSLEIPGLVDDLVQPKRVAAKKVQGVKRKRNTNNRKQNNKSSVKLSDGAVERKFNGYLTRAKRSRLADIENGNIVEHSFNECCVDDDDDEDPDYRKRKPKFTEKIYGSIPGVPVGTVWQFRMACSHDGVHRPTVAGIHGGEDGCYSIALSGGYEDDLDYGECLTFTGEGGRDLKGTKSNPKNLRTAPQSKDQTLTKGNLALSKNVENRNPVRVVRGYKLDSPYAPVEGYRYDGLYTVEKYWKAVGLSGFVVYKFALKRCPDQARPPWLDELEENSTALDESQARTDELPSCTDEGQPIFTEDDNLSGNDESDSCYGSEDRGNSENQLLQ